MKKISILLMNFLIIPIWAGDFSPRALIACGASASAGTAAEQVQPTEPCFLAQLPVPVANKIAGYCRYNDLVEELKRQPELRDRFFLRNNDLYRKPDPEKALSSLSRPTKLIDGPKRRSRFSAYNIPHVDKFAFAGDLLLLLQEVEGVEHEGFPSGIDLSLVRRLADGELVIKDFLDGAIIYRLARGGTPVNSYKVWPFTASVDSQNVFYVESIDGGQPQLVHQEKSDDSWNKKRIIPLERGIYSEIKYLSETNQIMLLKAAQPDEDSAAGAATAGADVGAGAGIDEARVPESPVIFISLDEHEVADESAGDAAAGAGAGAAGEDVTEASEATVVSVNEPEVVEDGTDNSAAVSETPAEVAQENLLELWLREKAVCKTLAASLPESPASLNDLD